MWHPCETGMNWLRRLERLLLIVGVLMLALYIVARIHGLVLSGAELQRFKGQLVLVSEPRRVTLTGSTPDFSLWSERRIQSYQESLAANFTPVIALFRIPKLHVEWVRRQAPAELPKTGSELPLIGLLGLLSLASSIRLRTAPKSD